MHKPEFWFSLGPIVLGWLAIWAGAHGVALFSWEWWAIMLGGFLVSLGVAMQRRALDP